MAARIKRGDRVVVLAGKDRGARGVVRQIIRKHERVIVEGVNLHGIIINVDSPYLDLDILSDNLTIRKCNFQYQIK